MRHWILAALAVICALFGTAFAQQQATTFADAAQVEKLITDRLHQMYEAEKRGDLDFILANLADDFAEVGGDGEIYRKADIKEHFHEVTVNSYSVQDMLFHRMTDDSAYVIYGLTVDATYNGQKFPGRFRVSTVWTKVNGDWKLRFEQGTIIPEKAPEKK